MLATASQPAVVSCGTRTAISAGACGGELVHSLSERAAMAPWTRHDAAAPLCLQSWVAELPSQETPQLKGWGRAAWQHRHNPMTQKLGEPASRHIAHIATLAPPPFPHWQLLASTVAERAPSLCRGARFALARSTASARVGTSRSGVLWGVSTDPAPPWLYGCTRTHEDNAHGGGAQKRGTVDVGSGWYHITVLARVGL